MQTNILFFQSTEFGGYEGQVGLFDLLITHINGIEDINIFEQIQVVVPNHAQVCWLKDKVAKRDGICANLDFVVLLGPVLQNIYHANNPDTQLFDFSNAKYIIYQYLCENKITSSDSDQLNSYILNDGKLDKYRTYQLATQLQQIFQEYLYLRADELLHFKTANFPEWQKQILSYLFEQIGEQKTFLDIYKYFSQLDLEQTNLILPKQLFIFGLTSVYPSQLRIIKKLAERVTVYWYYQLCSHEYYGDLLSSKAKSKLEKKLLKKPDLSLDDLYLTDGNPLLANLGQQSREFIELLNANDIQVYDFKVEPAAVTPTNLLEMLQQDIRAIKYRLSPEYRVNDNSSYYADPIKLKNLINVQVNSCHNRMREVQVMLNEIVALLNKKPHLKLEDILITAPDIDDYAAYISAVLDNELVTKEDGSQYKVLYNITGNRRQKNYKILECIQLIINTPYHLPVNYFVEILTQQEIQSNLGIDGSDVELVKKWLLDNAVHFGYDAGDYTEYGYIDYPTHSFKHWLNNLVLGACLNEDILTSNSILPIYSNATGNYTPYDNLDNSQINLANKLIMLINLLEDLRSTFYSDAETYTELSLSQIHASLNNLNDLLLQDENSVTVSESFLCSLLNITVDTTITLPILNLVLNDFVNDFKSKINFNGRITCASMQYMRNLPFACIYVLGMNFGEFPSSYNPNQLSILAKEWYLADRNYNIEDKQVFLDILLAAKEQIFFSYIGRTETDNSPIKPSPLLSLLLTTIGQSCTDFWDNDASGVTQKYDYTAILHQQSLHPFYNNPQQNYSTLWHEVGQSTSDDYADKRWDFSLTSPLQLTPQQKSVYLNLDIKALHNTFLYSNSNLYKVLGISNFDDEIMLDDIESLNLTSRTLAITLFNYLEQYAYLVDESKLYHYLISKGVLAYGAMGEIQFKFYLQLYKFYITQRGNDLASLNYAYSFYKNEEEIPLNISGKVRLEENNIIISNSFAEIRDKPLAEKLSELPYKLRMEGLIIYLLVHNNATIGDGVKVENVILRQLNTLNESRDFIISVADISLLKRVLAYYLRSLSNPVLIHKNAINTFAESRKMLNKDGSPRLSIEECMNKARTKYSESFNNVDLDNIKQDAIFSSIADNYFEYIAESNGLNDIRQIGEILVNLNG